MEDPSVAHNIKDGAGTAALVIRAMSDFKSLGHGGQDSQSTTFRMPSIEELSSQYVELLGDGEKLLGGDSDDDDDDDMLDDSLHFHPSYPASVPFVPLLSDPPAEDLVTLLAKAKQFMFPKLSECRLNTTNPLDCIDSTTIPQVICRDHFPPGEITREHVALVLRSAGIQNSKENVDRKQKEMVQDRKFLRQLIGGYIDLVHLSAAHFIALCNSNGQLVQSASQIGNNTPNMKHLMFVQQWIFDCNTNWKAELEVELMAKLNICYSMEQRCYLDTTTEASSKRVACIHSQITVVHTNRTRGIKNRSRSTCGLYVKISQSRIEGSQKIRRTMKNRVGLPPCFVATKSASFKFTNTTSTTLTLSSNPRPVFPTRRFAGTNTENFASQELFLERRESTMARRESSLGVQQNLFFQQQHASAKDAAAKTAKSNQASSMAEAKKTMYSENRKNKVRPAGCISDTLAYH